MSSIAVLCNRMWSRIIDRRQRASDISRRLSSHLAQADEYERLWYRQGAWRSRRRNRERTLLDQIQTLRQRILELEARNEELAAFDRSVAHELKNLLSRIVGYAEVLAAGDTVVTDKQLQHYLGTIAQDGRKLSSIIDALLVLCGASVEGPRIEPLAMQTIVSRALERLAHRIDGYQAKIILPDAWPVALGYGPWVEEVWVNFIHNACKYGGFLSRIELGASPLSGGKYIRFWVRDSGPGLSPGQQAQLFKPFARLHPAQADGNGFGLSIVRQIVTKMGGRAGVESDNVPGHGSTFTFDLPKVDA